LEIDAKDNERKVTEERVKYIDSLTLSPELRARKVYDIIGYHNASLRENDPDRVGNWDILCYAVTHLVSLANVFTWLQLPAKHLLFLVRNAHYLYPVGHGIIKDETDNSTPSRDT
jgi:hypothetical protein